MRSTSAADVEEKQFREVDWASEGTPPSETVGQELFESLFFDDKARALFDRSLGKAQEKGEGLRLKLRISLDDPDVARLANLPWELLYRGEYLNLSRETPIVRYLNVQKPFELLPFNPPLRILVVVSDPEGVAELDLDQERRSIEQTWGGKEGVEVDFLTHATVRALNGKLTERDYHVLHFMGHGDFDDASGVGVLVMENENGGADGVDGDSLGVALRDARSLRLVFLNACDTARSAKTAGQDPFAGVATALVLAGVPAVLAMQFPISDRAAITFAERLYPRLAQGVPLDAAVAEGRREIRLSERNSMEWATPVLFMRAPTGEIFTHAEGTVDEAAADVEPPAANDPDAIKPGEAAAVLSIVYASLYFLVAGFVAFISDDFLEFAVPMVLTTIALSLGVSLFGYALQAQADSPLRRALFHLCVASIGIHTAQVFAALVAIGLRGVPVTEFTYIMIAGIAVAIWYSALLYLHLRGTRGVRAGGMIVSVVVSVGWVVAMLNVDYAARPMSFEDLIQLANGGSAICVSAVFWYASRKLAR